jgi:hypothetical protein
MNESTESLKSFTAILLPLGRQARSTSAVGSLDGYLGGWPLKKKVNTRSKFNDLKEGGYRQQPPLAE